MFLPQKSGYGVNLLFHNFRTDRELYIPIRLQNQPSIVREKMIPKESLGSSQKIKRFFPGKSSQNLKCLEIPMKSDLGKLGKAI
jgi:uncharacterized protein YtpQ (UPF0354 family)